MSSHRSAVLLKDMLLGLILCMVSLVFSADRCAAVPLSTRYYSITLPADWSVLEGPTREKTSVRLSLANSRKTATATLVVGSAGAADMKKAVAFYARKLSLSPRENMGQTEFLLQNGTEKGYCIFRFDPKNSLLCIMSVSGDLSKARFLFSLHGPYPALYPRMPRDW